MSKPPIDPDASAYDLMAIYGALMQQVQTYELLLATLALLVEVDPKRVSNATLKRQLKAAVRKGVHAFQNGSPAASRDRLEGEVRPISTASSPNWSPIAIASHTAFSSRKSSTARPGRAFGQEPPCRSSNTHSASASSTASCRRN